jgi:hypothetical protein
VLIFCALSAFVFVATAILSSAGVYVQGYIGAFGLDIIELLFPINALVSLIAFVWMLVRKYHAPALYGALAVNALALSLLHLAQVPRRVESWNFSSRLERRLQVVELAEAGKLQGETNGPCDCVYAHLPAQYSNVSSGGVVLVARHSGGFSVTFFVSRWGLFADDDYTAFVYRSDGNRPREEEDDTFRYVETRPLRANWFYVRHT